LFRLSHEPLLAGENRVGFFTKKDVEAGEELNFDYKYERYGQVSLFLPWISYILNIDLHIQYIKSMVMTFI
jgi:hypothetical protein